jgi:hypothetical protein
VAYSAACTNLPSCIKIFRQIHCIVPHVLVEDKPKLKASTSPCAQHAQSSSRPAWSPLSFHFTADLRCVLLALQVFSVSLWTRNKMYNYNRSTYGAADPCWAFTSQSFGAANEPQSSRAGPASRARPSKHQAHFSILNDQHPPHTDQYDGRGGRGSGVSYQEHIMANGSDAGPSGGLHTYAYDNAHYDAMFVAAPAPSGHALDGAGAGLAEGYPGVRGHQQHLMVPQHPQEHLNGVYDQDHGYGNAWRRGFSGQQASHGYVGVGGPWATDIMTDGQYPIYQPPARASWSDPSRLPSAWFDDQGNYDAWAGPGAAGPGWAPGGAVGPEYHGQCGQYGGQNSMMHSMYEQHGHTGFQVGQQVGVAAAEPEGHAHLNQQVSMSTLCARRSAEDTVSDLTPGQADPPSCPLHIHPTESGRVPRHRGGRGL